MSDHQDYLERTLDAPAHVAMAKIQKARNPHTAIWWIAAVVAVAAVVGAIFILRTSRPSTEKLQAAHDQGVADVRLDVPGHGGPQLAVARAAQAATTGRTQTTEASAQAAVHDASATVASSGPN
jgi:hypothetical protein